MAVARVLAWAILCIGSGLVHAFESVQQLTGCWQAGTPAQQTIEIWTAPQGQVMFGLGYSLREGKVINHETLRIEVDTQQGNQLVYEASPAGQATTRFVLESGDAHTLVFSNPSHDFPKRIVYRRSAPDTLLARAEAGERGFDLEFRKMACEPLFTSQPISSQELP